MTATFHQSQLAPAENKFHKGNGKDKKHYWITPADLYARLHAQKGKTVVLVYPVDKRILLMVKTIFGENVDIRNLGDVKLIATEDQTAGKGTGRHIACFILRAGSTVTSQDREAAK